MSAGHPAALREQERTSRLRDGHPRPVPLIATHHSAPGGRPVGHPALVRTLAEARGAALTLVVAPPGYGKSTLLADWAEYDERPFVWLEPGDHWRAAPRVLDGADGAGRISVA